MRMGKSVVATNLISRAKSFWGWFIKKSPAFIVLTSLTVVSVFGLGVGGTLAATGVIPNPFASSAVPEPTEDSEELPMTSPDEVEESPGARIDGEWIDCRLVDGVWKFTPLPQDCPDETFFEYPQTVDPDWIGVKYEISKNEISMIAQGRVTTQGSVRGAIWINGRVYFETTTYCDASKSIMQLPPTEICRIGYFTYSQDFWNVSVCQPGGDNYLVEVTGGGLNFRETGLIPAGVIDCPSPTPTTESSPTPTSEPSPTPAIETSPSPSSEPSPSPTSP